MNKLYAAYGSNMNIEQMKLRCPAARIEGIGYLLDETLTFRRTFANVEPQEGERVPVVIWSLTPECERALDRYEGYPRFYHKEDLPVEMNGERHSIMAYVMNREFWSEPSVPQPEYYATIRQGYRENGFDPEILDTYVREAREQASLK